MLNPYELFELTGEEENLTFDSEINNDYDYGDYLYDKMKEGDAYETD